MSDLYWRTISFISPPEALFGKSAADGSDPPFCAIGIIHFESSDALRAALSGEHAPEVIGDISNFTDVQPIIQINERIAAAI